MATKSDIRIEQAHALLDRVASELGLSVADTSFGKKVQGPANKHRIYIQKGQFLGRIDTTVPLAADDPAFVPLGSPNGSISCHVRPDLEQLERCLRMLGDSSLGTQVPNRPRPFSAPKAPPVRQPKAVVSPVPIEAVTPLEHAPGADLKQRIATIKAAARRARIQMVLENPGKYGHLSEEEAADLVDGRYGAVEAHDVAEAAHNSHMAVTTSIIAESGIEVSQ